MKNVFVLPTDKPSRLFYNVGGTLLFTNYKHYNGVNIYITSDEEIKEGDWLIVNDEDVMQMKSSYDNDMSGEDIWVGDSLNGYATYKDNCKKIILTTDQDLINLGVQAIDDEFLEWFVKNPSCEEVEVSEDYFKPSNMVYGHDTEPYKIIIPKEETKLKNICIKCGVDLYATEGRFECQKHPKECKGIYLSEETLLIHAAQKKQQHLIDMMKADEELGLYEEPKQENCCTPIGQIKRYIDCKGCSKKPKQETTPEEVAEYLGFVKGAKWQQEQDSSKYSEEEVNKMFDTLKRNSINNVATITNVDLFISSWKKEFKNI